MTRWMLCTATLLLSVLFLPARSLAQPTTSGTAVKSAHIGMVNNVVISTPTQAHKWYLYVARAGRSYCVEAGADISTDANAKDSDPAVTIWASDGTTQLGYSGDTSVEPVSSWGSRACFRAQQSGDFYVQVSTQSTGTYTYRMRVVETTLWASWFFIGGDYNSFVLLRNTTGTTVNYTITWRNPNSTVIGTTSGGVGAHAALGINARTFISNPAVNFNGTVEIAHDGSPQALVGQVTSLSATTGLGYDSMFFQRQNVW